MTMPEVPIEFRGNLIPAPEPPAASGEVAALAAFAADMTRELGETPRLYQLNRARLALADRHALLRRATPARGRGKLDDVFNRAYGEIFDRALKLDAPELSPPPPPPVALPPPPPEPRPRSVAEAMMVALQDVV